MARTVLAGTRIRDIRTAKRIKQVELAQACDISPSYLNLIEHNRRRIGGALLLRIAAALKVEASSVSEGAEAGLAVALEAAADAAPGVGAEAERLEELASRFPGWARMVAHQYAEVRRLEQVVERMGDRLTHDPHLSASMHSVLTSVTAIRSASAILASGEKVEPEWQARFHRNIYEDSQRLANATETLVSYLDAETGEGIVDGTLPQEDVDLWLAGRNWHFEELEENPDTEIDAIVSKGAMLRSNASRDLARRYLSQYAADTRAIRFGDLIQANELGISPGQMAQEFGVSLPVVFRRLASLDGGAGASGPTTYGLVGSDASGTLIYRKSLPGFDLPRYSGACPLWPLFQSLQRPMVPLSAQLLLSGRHDMRRFLATAVSEVSHPAGYDGPAATTAWMLFAAVQEESPAIPSYRVGTTCRVCAEHDCTLRREGSVFSSSVANAL